MSSNSTILVTGGAGYIESILTRKLVEKNFNVKVIDSLVFGNDGILDLINDNKNVIIFISNEVSKRTGIYYIIKKTNAKAILVKKKIENKRFNGWEDRILDIFGKRQEIKYIAYNYDCNLDPIKFMEQTKTVLFSNL